MKKMVIFLTVFATLLQFNASAQCVGIVAPLMDGGIFPMPITTTAPDPSTFIVQQAVNLPNVEFIISKVGTFASDNNGNPALVNGQFDYVALGTVGYSTFDPATVSRYGINIAPGDTFQLTAVGYDLNKLKVLVDSLLTGEISSGNPCCNIFLLIPDMVGFCDSMNNAGIHSGADINNFNDVMTVFDLMSANQLSVSQIDTVFSIMNSYAPVFPAPCKGSSLPLCYGLSLNHNNRYKMVRSFTTGLNELENQPQIAVYPNPTKNQINFAVQVNVQLTNLTGQVVANKANTQGLDITDLPTGFYFLTLTADSGQVLQRSKIVKE